MDAYYEEIAAYLHERYDLAGASSSTWVVVTAGSSRSCALPFPGLRGLGVDPALDRDRTEADGRMVLVKDVFTSEVVREQPSLVVSRHVLEHIPQPVTFLRTISESLSAFDPCPCFFEFPDLDGSSRTRRSGTSRTSTATTSPPRARPRLSSVPGSSR
jgi:hypothetical protein